MTLWPRPRCTAWAAPVLLAAALAQAAPADLAEPPPAPRAGADLAAADPLADAVLVAINHLRQQANLPVWVADEALATIAAAHSQAQAAQGRLSHGGFQQRFAQTRARWCVENLAAGHHNGQAVVDAWRASPQHQQNLLDPGVNRVGVASSAGVVSMLACRISPR